MNDTRPTVGEGFAAVADAPSRAPAGPADPAAPSQTPVARLLLRPGPGVTARVTDVVRVRPVIVDEHDVGARTRQQAGGDPRRGSRSYQWTASWPLGSRVNPREGSP